MMPTQYRPARLEEMTEVECSRLFLWQFLLVRRHNHLAHLIFATGFRLIESLRCMPPGAEALSYGTRREYAQSYDPWMGALLAVATKLDEVGSSPDVVKKVRALYEKTVAAYAMLTMHPLPSEMSQHESPPPNVQESTSCITAPAQAATPKSPNTCSPAEPTGLPSPPTCTVPSGQPTMGTARVATESMSSDDCKRLSSQPQYKKGTGHPRRGNPYTRKKGKT